MPLDNCFRAYGRYLVTWNGLQPVLDVAIVREAGLALAQGAIVVAALNQKTRLTVLRGLLANAGGEKADAVPLLAEIAQAAKKQPLIQGAGVAGGADSLRFLRPEVAGRLAPSSAEYTAQEIDALADELAAQIETLAAALAVTPADVDALKRAGDEIIARRRKDRDADLDD
jgi:hypothetical protein